MGFAIEAGILSGGLDIDAFADTRFDHAEDKVTDEPGALLAGIAPKSY